MAGKNGIHKATRRNNIADCGNYGDFRMINEIQMPLVGSCVARFDQRRIWPAARRKRNKRAGGNTWARVQMRIKRRVLLCSSNIIPFCLSHLNDTTRARARLFSPKIRGFVYRAIIAGARDTACIYTCSLTGEKSPRIHETYLRCLRVSTHLVFTILI